MTAPFMRAYTELLVRTCHKRGAHAIGGMAAFIPSKDPEVNEAAFAEGPRRQDPRGRRRLRRLVGGPPRHGADLPGGLRRGPRRPAEPDGPEARGRPRHRGAAARRGGRPRATSPRRACATTSASASSTSRPGCGARARSASSTSWRTPPPRRSPARRSGSGCTTTSSSTPVTSSRASWSSAWSTRRSPSCRATRQRLRRGPRHVRRGRRRRRLRRVPHPAGVRADALSDGRARSGRPAAPRARRRRGHHRPRSGCAPTSATGSRSTR